MSFTELVGRLLWFGGFEVWLDHPVDYKPSHKSPAGCGGDFWHADVAHDLLTCAGYAWGGHLG